MSAVRNHSFTGGGAAWPDLLRPDVAKKRGGASDYLSKPVDVREFGASDVLDHFLVRKQTR